MNERLSNWIVFFMSPFASVFLIFKDYTKPYAKNIFWAFCVFYGFTFAIGTENSGSDINRYLDQLYYLHSQTNYGLRDIILFFNVSGEIDIFNISITYLVSRFSDNRAFLTLVYGIFFGYFYSRNIWYILNLTKGRLSLLLKLLLFTLILIVPVWYINGIRMYLAFHVFFFGLLPFIFENKKEKLIYVYITWLIHFSFFIPIAIFIIYRLIGNRLNLYFLAFIFSIFTVQINLNTINNTVESILPQRLVERSDSYISESTLEAKKNKNIIRPKNWYVTWNSILLRWSLYLITIFLFVFRNQLFKKYANWRKLFSITLIYFASANILLGMPSGSRYMIFPLFLSLTLIILYINQFRIDVNFKKLVQILTPAFILFILVSIRVSLYSVSITTLLGNPFFAIFNIGETISINDLIK